jgi:hypothetical protein
MTPDGLRAQYLIPNLSPNANAYPSIRPFRSGHVTTQSREISANSPFAERKQTADRKFLCRILLKKPSFSGRIFSPSWAHKSDSFLYQISVLTGTTWKSCEGLVGPIQWVPRRVCVSSHFAIRDGTTGKSVRDE